MLLTLELFRLQGLEECGEASAADRLLLRILTPITKLYTAKQVSIHAHSMCLYSLR